VCIELIDADVLYSGANVDDIKRVFQEDFEDMGFGDRSNKLAIVHFVKPVRSSNPMEATEWTGWYLSITYRENGAILDYSLGNESKSRSMRLQYERQKSNGRIDVGIPVLGKTNEFPTIVTTNSVNTK